jgi:hypothetical protein
VFYKNGGNKDLVACIDNDYAGDLNDRKSTSGYMFLLSSGIVSWSSNSLAKKDFRDVWSYSKKLYNSPL